MAEGRRLTYPAAERHVEVVGLALNMFCQYIHLWMYVIPAADLYLFTSRCRIMIAPRSSWNTAESTGKGEGGSATTAMRRTSGKRTPPLRRAPPSGYIQWTRPSGHIQWIHHPDTCCIHCHSTLTRQSAAQQLHTVVSLRALLQPFLQRLEQHL